MCPKLTLISSLVFLIAFLTLVSNYCTPTLSFLLHSQHLHISNSTWVFSRKEEKYLSGQTSSFEYKASLCHAQPVKGKHPSLREHPNTRVSKLCKNEQGLHTFTLTLPKFGTPAFTNPAVFWMAAWDKPNTNKRKDSSTHNSVTGHSKTWGISEFHYSHNCCQWTVTNCSPAAPATGSGVAKWEVTKLFLKGSQVSNGIQEYL